MLVATEAICCAGPFVMFVLLLHKDEMNHWITVFHLNYLLQLLFTRLYTRKNLALFKAASVFCYITQIAKLIRKRPINSVNNPFVYAALRAKGIIQQLNLAIEPDKLSSILSFTPLNYLAPVCTR